jgi:hypothetical protein
MFSYLKIIKNINFDNDTNDEIKFIQKIYQSNTDCPYQSRSGVSEDYVSLGFKYGLNAANGYNYMIFDKNINLYIPPSLTGSGDIWQYDYDLFELDDEDVNIFADYMFKGLVEIKEINGIRYYLFDNIAKKISKKYSGNSGKMYISNNNKFMILTTLKNTIYDSNKNIQIFMSFNENNMKLFTDKLDNQHIKDSLSIQEIKIQNNREIIINNHDEYDKNNKIIYNSFKELNNKCDSNTVEIRILYCCLVVCQIIIIAAILSYAIIRIIVALICKLKTKKKKICNNRIDEMDDMKNHLFDDVKTSEKICNTNDNLLLNSDISK